MTKQALAVPWPLRAKGVPRHRLPSIALAAFIAGFAIAGTVDAKQQCSVAAGKHGYWSWRMIDDRKCWYEGKPMLSKALLEWPAEGAEQPDTKAETATAAPEIQRSESHSDPMDAQAYAPAGS